MVDIAYDLISVKLNPEQLVGNLVHINRVHSILAPVLVKT